MYFWDQKYQNPPHVVFRGIARAAALHGARKIKPMRHPVADAPQPAPSFSASNESAELLCRHGRHRVKYQFTQTDRFCLFFRKFDSLFSARWGPTWFRWRKSVRKAESDSGGDGLLANPRIVARRRFQTSGRRHRNRSGGFCCFSPSKSREKRKSFLMYFWGQKYQKPPHPLFPRQTRVRIYCAANGGIILYGMRPAFFLPARRSPTWFRWRESGRKTESASGGDGLLANPRSRPTPLSAFRTPTSESVGWLLLLFDTEKQLKKKKFSARRPKIAKGFRENFCCFSLLKSSKKKVARSR